jgi:hypothetical protein
LNRPVRPRNLDPPFGGVLAIFWLSSGVFSILGSSSLGGLNGLGVLLVSTGLEEGSITVLGPSKESDVVSLLSVWGCSSIS